MPYSTRRGDGRSRHPAPLSTAVQLLSTAAIVVGILCARPLYKSMWPVVYASHVKRHGLPSNLFSSPDLSAACPSLFSADMDGSKASPLEQQMMHALKVLRDARIVDDVTVISVAEQRLDRLLDRYIAKRIAVS